MQRTERRFVLAGDARFVPRTTFADAALRGLPGEPGDYILLRERSRASSTVLSPSTRELLEEFAAPVTIVEAVISFCRKHRNLGQAESVLEEAYPALLDLVTAGHLRAAGGPQQPLSTLTIEGAFGA